MNQSIHTPLPAAKTHLSAVGYSLPAARTVLVLVMLAAVWLGVMPLTSVPPVTPASAAADVFSAERALQDLAVVAAQPHPTGSPANAAVRDYLLAEITKLGLQPELQRATISELSPLSGIAQVTPVENIMVRVRGAAGTGDAVLLTGHYDSVPTTPGAGDCGSCVVTVLETLRAVLAGPPLQNDVIFLFTDAEELGIVGATAFMRQHPWAQDVRLSLVLEGLGTNGSSLLYATGPDHGNVVREALGAMQAPAAYAYIHDLMWKISGNSGSDLDAFVADGRPGLAFVHFSLDGSQSYHSGGDNVQALDAGTLQQHGEQALSLVRHFGSAPLNRFGAEPDAVYFSLLPSFVVHYPLALAWPLALVAALLALAAVIYGWRRHAFTLLGLLAAFFTVVLGLLLVVTVGTSVWWLLRLWNSNLHMYAVGGWYGAAWTAGGLVLLSLALLAVLHLLWRLRLSMAALAAAGLLWWGALALLTAQALPGFGYLFAWPLLPAALAAAWCWWQPAAAQRPWPRALVLAVPAFSTLLLVAPFVFGLTVFAGRMEGMTGLPLAALPLPFVALVWALLVPQVEFLTPQRRWWQPALLLTLALLLLAVGWTRSGFDPTHPKLNSVVYWLDADTQTARWITVDDSRSGRGTSAQLDEWTSQFFSGGATPTTFNPWPSGWFTAEYPALQAAAPAIEMPHSQVVVLEDSTLEGGRLLRLQFTPAAGVQDFYVQVQSEDDLQIVAVNGESVTGQPAPSVRLNAYGRPQTPITLDVRAPAGSPVQVQVNDRRIGLPDSGFAVTPRPDWMAAAPFNDISDSTIVAHTLTIE